MPIPDYQTIMKPLLAFSGDKKEHSLHEAIERLSEEFRLTKDELRQKTAIGQQNLFGNRVGWALTCLKKAGLLESTKRSHFRITDEGLRILAQNPARVDRKLLSQYPSFKEFQSHRPEAKPERQISVESSTPEELIEAGYWKKRDALAEDLLKRVKEAPPKFLEDLVIKLLLNMGYGGSLEDAGESLGSSGDEGVDGVIKEDKLGLDAIYVQAKRWDTVVGRPEIQAFVGALIGKKARKGIFITTSSFSQEARRYAESIDSKVVLIDGERLAQLMIDYNVGVTTENVYEIKKIDLDYFPEK